MAKAVWVAFGIVLVVVGCGSDGEELAEPFDPSFDPSTTPYDASIDASALFDAHVPFGDASLPALDAAPPFQRDAGAADSGAADASPALDGGSNPYATASVCTSNKHWTSGDRGNEQMHPGRACITCHTGGFIPRGPKFIAAGTVFPTAHEPDDCNGASQSGVTVKLKGANGQVVTLTPNAAGNFFSTASLSMPYTAEVTYQGRTRSMLKAQTTGDCNSCHTENGANAAPGRIMLP